MELVTPGIGLLFWTTLSFIILLLLLGKFAWKPIIGAINDRNKSIEDALLASEKTKEEMALLKSDNEKILAEARKERDNLLKDARDMKDQLIAEAKTRATEEAAKLLASAKMNIENEKNAAITEIKKKVAELSIEIAEKLLVKELTDKKTSDDLINKSLENLKLN
ncbi:MAG: F0F1 ATP synthase subunit B [Bacteroidales bacterium]|nr:F0F1 ATP synthase subunit B [Bacteroidales bacterium]